MDRATRREIKHDKFVDEMEHVYDLAAQNRNRVLMAIGGVVAAIVIVIGGYVYLSKKERDGQARLAEAITILDAPVGDAAPATAPKYKDENEKIAKAEPILNEVASKYSGTDAADVAEIYLARIVASRGDLESAKTKLRDFLREHPDHILAATAERSLMDLRLATEPPKDLITELENQLNQDETRLPKDAILILIARAAEIGNDPAKAREAYQRIVNEYPDSPYSIDAQRKVAPR